ncbi:MAG: hypothetical protein OES47_10205 [Acidobacteriota bacterium]|nr:hypothetical protein [Acidobacteriota bacterium]
MKSAYEIALEKLADRGIEGPREDALSPADREKAADARSRAEASLAELEILHHDRLAKTPDPDARTEEEEEYRRERTRIEERRDGEIAALRND